MYRDPGDGEAKAHSLAMQAEVGRQAQTITLSICLRVRFIVANALGLVVLAASGIPDWDEVGAAVNIQLVLVKVVEDLTAVPPSVGETTYVIDRLLIAETVVGWTMIGVVERHSQGIGIADKSSGGIESRSSIKKQTLWLILQASKALREVAYCAISMAHSHKVESV